MGEARRRQYSREDFLKAHPRCAYCGDFATTTDHCPPRCFFDRRDWPETFEFPSCASCNQASRLDEQALAVLARIRLQDQGEPGRTEWQRLVDGVRNNQEAIFAEWISSTPIQRKRFFQSAVGAEMAMKMHEANFGALRFGPLTNAAVGHFGVKLGKAFYYRHMQELFEGDIYVRFLDPFLKSRNPDHIDKIVDMAPGILRPKRNTKSLADRFAYRFNYSTEIGVIYTVIQFGSQLTFSIMAVRKDTAEQLRKDTADDGAPVGGLFHCSLIRPQ
jgi:hypothetical protein